MLGIYSRKGQVVIITLILVVAFAAITASLFMSSVGEWISTRRQRDTTKAVWVAEAGLQQRMRDIETWFNNGPFPTNFPVDSDEIGDTYTWQNTTFFGGNYNSSATLIHIREYAPDTPDYVQEDPPSAEYVYLIEAEANISALPGPQGFTTRKAQCAVAYDYLGPTIFIDRDNRTLGRRGATIFASGGIYRLANIMHFGNLDLPPGRYSMSFRSVYTQVAGPPLPPNNASYPLAHEDAYIHLGDSNILLEEWTDDGDGFEVDGVTPCVANDSVVCYGEYNIPWEMQNSHEEWYEHIDEDGVHENPLYTFEISDEEETEIAEFACHGGTPSDQDAEEGSSGFVGTCWNDLDLEEDSTCSQFCNTIDDACIGQDCITQCWDGCLDNFQWNHPDSECHRRCEPIHCMRWCAQEYQLKYPQSECNLLCASEADQASCVQTCIADEQSGQNGREECKDFCGIEPPNGMTQMEACLTECTLDTTGLQLVYDGSWHSAFLSECHRICDNITGPQQCLDNCDFLFFREDIQGDMLLRTEIGQFDNQRPYLQGAMEFDKLILTPEDPGASITDVQWITYPSRIEMPPEDHHGRHAEEFEQSF